MTKSSIKAVSHIVPDNDPPKYNHNQFRSQIYTREKKDEEITCTKYSRKFPKKSSFGTTNNQCPYCR